MTIRYDWSIVKFNKDGARVISDTLEKGEKLVDGTTYKQERKRLEAERPESSPFAQGSMEEQNDPDTTAFALTLDETQTNTKRDTDETPEPAEVSDPALDTKATVSEDGDSTAVVHEGDSSGEEVKDDGAKDLDANAKTVDPPRPSDSKQEWYDYATKNKGLKANYDDITKNEIVAFVNDSAE